MGACASKPKVKDDLPGPAPISASKDLAPPDNVPPAPKDIAVDGDAVAKSDHQRILFKEKADEQKSTESENTKSETAKQDGQMLGETEIKLLESAAKTLSENAEQDVSSLKDNMLEGSDQIKKAVEIIKEQVPTQTENRPNESETEPRTKPREPETTKNVSDKEAPPSSAKEDSETKSVSEPEKDAAADNASSQVYVDASDKMVIDKSVIEHKLNNGVNPETEKAKKELSVDTKIQSNGKVAMEKDSQGCQV